MTASTTTVARPASGAPDRRGHNVIVSAFEWFGELGIFTARLARAALTPPYEIREFLHQCDGVSSKSLPLVALAGAARNRALTADARQPQPLG